MTRRNCKEITQWAENVADIIKGFAAEAAESSLETVSTMSTQYEASIEEDGVVTTQKKDGTGF
jgi:hypothetical protein